MRTLTLLIVLDVACLLAHVGLAGDEPRIRSTPLSDAARKLVQVFDGHSTIGIPC